ncbi:MAG: hypothetical protein ACE5RC_01530, partial [Nitrosopumilus sp.]
MLTPLEVFSQGIMPNNELIPTDEIPWWILLILGAIISTIIQNIFSGLIPDKIREKIHFWKKFISKIFKRTSVNVELICKTLDSSTKNISSENLKEGLRKCFVEKNFEVTTDLNSLSV